MGILDHLGLKPKIMPPPEVLAAPLFETLATHVDTMPIADLWEEQPHLRTVTDFIARSVSSTAIHAYRFDEDGGRVRVREGAIAHLCKQASDNGLMSTLIYNAVMEACLYDEFIWYIRHRVDGPPEILPIPSTWVVSKHWHDPWTLKSIYIRDDKMGYPIELPAEDLIFHHGYSTRSLKRGTSPVLALKDTLREQLESAAYRAQLWKHGPRISGVITRPQNAPWDDAARRRFKAAWRSQYSGRGSGAGGTPLLEDGMDFKSAHLTAKDEQFVDVAKLSLQTVASVYHVSPVMVGLLDNANYSNVREFRKSLYGDSLGPIIDNLEGTLNQFLLPKLAKSVSEDELDGIYLEFNVDSKLRASFEEKAQVTSTAVGGPWMTVNEARGMNNLPTIEGGDDLIRPLNLGVAGETPSPEPGEELPP